MSDPNRRALIEGLGALALYGTLSRWAPAYAAAVPAAPNAPSNERVIDLVIDEFPLRINERVGSAIAVNGSVPGPLVRLREGETAVLRVSNLLKEISSIH